MLNVEDKSRVLNKNQKNTNIPVILIAADICANTNCDNSTYSENTKHKSQSMIDAKSTSNSPVIISQNSTKDKAAKNREMFNDLSQSLLKSGNSHKANRSGNSLFLKSSVADNFSNTANNYLLKNYTRKSKSRIALNSNGKCNDDQKLFSVKPRLSASIFNLSQDLDSFKLNPTPSITSNLMTMNDLSMKRLHYMKSSNLSLFKSTNSLNALDVDNISLGSVDRHSLYSNCSDCLYFVEPMSELDVKELSCVTKSRSGDDLNKTFKQYSFKTIEFDDTKAEGKESKAKHDKVINWLRNT